MPARIPTPIPVGSPHVAKPPAFEPWRWTTARSDRRERRDYARREIACDVWLIDLESQSVLRCKTDDICDAGMSASAPVGFGLAVGQRYEVRIAPSRTAAMTPHLAASLGYATIVRSGIQVNSDRPDRVGFAVRFDVPQLIPV
jgi:hypothetical protein